MDVQDKWLQEGFITGQLTGITLAGKAPTGD